MRGVLVVQTDGMLGHKIVKLMGASRKDMAPWKLNGNISKQERLFLDMRFKLHNVKFEA